MRGWFSWRYMEPVEWVLLFTVAASALCIVTLVIMLIVGWYRMHRKGSGLAAGREDQTDLIAFRISAPSAHNSKRLRLGRRRRRSNEQLDRG